MESSQVKINLRDRKAAATRLAITQAVSERLKTRQLGDISVEEIAEVAGVSRMTVFNYFPSKERILDHLFLTWLYEEQCESQRQGLRGVAGILHLFEFIGRLVGESPIRARQLAAWSAGRPFGLPYRDLTIADRMLVDPDLAEHPLVMGRERFLALVEEARQAGEIDLPGSDFELAHLIGTLLFATPLLGHSASDLDWEQLYLHHARRALGIDMGVSNRKKVARTVARPA
ncbi:MAG TPA: TetR/AcrR family transcriptional regulator [Marmoricola sp.]|nr:TetR/AcrR family transcriptional regulator [Marmoricola sp.]